MQLTYRGISYQASIATIDAPKREAIGCYRGHGLQFSQPVTISPPLQALKYRGILYNSAAIEAISARLGIKEIKEIAVNLMRPVLLIAFAFLTAIAASIASPI
jgi:hypothetical protein